MFSFVQTISMDAKLMSDVKSVCLIVIMILIRNEDKAFSKWLILG